MNRFPLRLFAAVTLASLVAGCHARKTYPDAAPGWHSPDYSIVFGRLQRVLIPPSATQPDAEAPPPVWTIRFGLSQDPYSGEFALTPADRLVGYSGGENVEIRGHRATQPTSDVFNGRWYSVDSIRMWNGHH